MLTFEQAQEIVRKVEMPNHLFEICQLNAYVDSFDTRTFDTEIKFGLRVRFMRKDIHTKEFGWGTSRMYGIDASAGEREVVQTALRACLDLAEHEVREAFTYEGNALYTPHPDLDILKQATAS